MTRNSIKLAVVVSVAVAALSSSVTMAAPTNWDMPGGSQPTFTYSGGQSANGHFHNPTVIPGGFIVAPRQFIAMAAASGVPSPQPTAGASDTVSDTLSVILSAKPNQQFTRISSGLVGDFSIFGIGNVDGSGLLRVTNLDTSASLTSPLGFDGTLPQVATSSNTNGFEGTAELALPAGWTNIKVEFDGSLTANALFGSSLIQGKGLDIGIETAEIPVPAAVLAAPVLAAIGYRARKMFMK